MQVKEARQHGSPYLPVCHIRPLYVPLFMRGCIVAIRQDPLDGAEPYTGLQLESKGLGQLTVFVSGAHSDLCLRVDVVAACVFCAREAVGTHPACFTMTTLPAIRLGAAKRASW